MNRILIFILLIINTECYCQDEKSNEILQQLSINTKTYKNIDVDFNYNFENITESINEKQKGNTNYY
jgi:hypothetical protein